MKKDFLIKKSLKTTPYQLLDEKLKSFINNCNANKINLSVPLIQEAAIRFANQMNINFNGSRGYFEKFCKRNNIGLQKIYGEASSVQQEKTEKWLRDLPDLIKNYNPKNIFNADETGLYYRLLPNTSYGKKKKKLSIGKMSKERVTIFLEQIWMEQRSLIL